MHPLAEAKGLSGPCSVRGMPGRRTGRFERVVDPVHFDGVVGFGARVRLATVPPPEPIGAEERLRPLLEYERLVGGRW